MRQLAPEKYHILKEQLAKVTINCFFARSVIERHVNGIVYVDDEANPKNAYILHPYGMSLLIGDGKNIEFMGWLIGYMLNRTREQKKDEWMQVFSENWSIVLKKELGDCLLPAEKNICLNYSDYVEVNTRVNFIFNESRYREEQHIRINDGSVIKKLDKETVVTLHGSVIPLNFWNNEDDFLKRGIGFSVFVNKDQASTAYSAFVHEKYLEIGIETVGRLRGLGYAKLVCGTLIDYCIENNFEPIWSCRLENTGSYNLAISLGFEPTVRLPYYRLCRKD